MNIDPQLIVYLTLGIIALIMIIISFVGGKPPKGIL